MHATLLRTKTESRRQLGSRGKLTRQRPTAISMVRIQGTQEIDIVTPIVRLPHIRCKLVAPFTCFVETTTRENPSAIIAAHLICFIFSLFFLSKKYKK
jgi:hypothetical protein